MHAELRPVDRLYLAGPDALSDAETLALLIEPGRPKDDSVQRLAETLLDAYGGMHELAKAAATELARQPNIGRTRAARIKAAFTLGQRVLRESTADRRPTVRCQTDVANLLMYEMALLDQEEMRVLLLNVKNRLIDIVTVYRGNLSTVIVRTGEVFRDAVRRNADGIIVVHNHPTGDPTPSPDDIATTRHLYATGQMLQIQLRDHIIIGRNSFVSLRERGLGFGDDTGGASHQETAP